jgi:hypothetical protein
VTVTLELQGRRTFASIILAFVVPCGSQRNWLMSFVRAKTCADSEENGEQATELLTHLKTSEFEKFALIRAG